MEINIDNLQKIIQSALTNASVFIEKTIIQDYVRFHHLKILKEFCQSNNIGLHYIPAYTPDANPIEHPKKHFRKMNHNDIIADIKLSIIKVQETPNLKNKVF